MTRKARSHDVLGKLSAFSMAVILLLSVFVPMFASTVEAGAAASPTVSAGDVFKIHLSVEAQAYWSDPMQVRFTDSSGNTLATQSITAPVAGGSATITAPKSDTGATNIVVDNLDSTRQNIKDEIAQKAADATDQGKQLVLFDNTSSNWGQVNCYIWKTENGTTTKEADWPGLQMTNTLTNNTNIYYKYIDQSAYPNIIFSNNGASQTDNLLTPSGSSNLYDSAVSKWTEYSAIVNSAALSVSDRVEDGKNHLYLTGEKTAKWSKYGDTIDLTTVYFKPSAAWSQAYVTYDGDDPYSTTVSIEKYTTSTENPNAPLIFKAQVPVGAKLTFADGTGDQIIHEVKNVYYNGNTSDNTYIQASTQWDTLEKALATASTNVDYTVTTNNFSMATPSSDQKVVGVNATYYDYLSNNELTQGWRNGLVTDQHSDTDDYCLQFSTFNNKLKEVATGDNSWRYPLYFGNYYQSRKDALNAYYIGDRANNTQTFFDAANNSNWLANNGGQPAQGSADYHRSVMGLVQKNLSGGNLMVTPNTQAPWFNNDLLKPPAESGGVSSTTNSGVSGSANGVYFSGSMNGWTTNDSAWELTTTDNNLSLIHISEPTRLA